MKVCVLLALMGLCYSGKAQSVFKVVRTIKGSAVRDVDAAADTATYYRIHLSGDTSEANRPYPFDFSRQVIDTISAIAELLLFENDDRRCALPIVNYGPGRDQPYTGRDTHFSIQVEALFLINQLVYSSPFTYAAYPVLYDDLNKRELATSGIVISQAYYAYRKWFKKVKKIGLHEIRERSIMPLDGAFVRWY
jgi:hypothetical protein